VLLVLVLVLVLVLLESKAGQRLMFKTVSQVASSLSRGK
jgi:hypothetical protein